MKKVNLSNQNRKSRRALKHALIKDILGNKFEREDGSPIDSSHLLISTLLPPAVRAFIEEVTREVDAICGERYRHGKEVGRWGTQKGSIILANQRIAVERPRVRVKGGEEVELNTYQQFQEPHIFNKSVFSEGIKRVSQRDYEKGVSKIANSFGFRKSQISKRWIIATSKKLEHLQGRDLSQLDIGAVFIDGKRFRKYGVIIALGIAKDGKKQVLGIFQADTENSLSCIELLNQMEKRGLPSHGLVFIVDGGSGLNKALEQKYDVHDRRKRRALRIRCCVHKWRNLEKSLGESADQVKGLFWGVRDAATLTQAKEVSQKLEALLRILNLSALNSYLEAKEDLLIVHELKLSKSLKRFFSTTNPIESLNSLVEEDMRRVKRWRNSEHFQRWLATYCLASETRMRRIRGHAALPGLWVSAEGLTHHEVVDPNQQVA